MNSKYAFPRTELIGRTIVITDEIAGSAYDERRRAGHRTVVKDAGNMIGGSDYWIECEDGTHFRTDQFNAWRIL